MDNLTLDQRHKTIRQVMSRDNKPAPPSASLTLEQVVEADPMGVG